MLEFKIIDNNLVLYEEMIRDILSAKKSVYLETYIFCDDKIGKKFKQALTQKAEEGLDIKLLLDDYGSSVNNKYFKDLNKAGGDVHFFRKIKFHIRLIHKNNHRNHRKILVIDDNITYLGSSNINAKTLSWREINLKIHGDISHIFKRIILQNFKIHNKNLFKKKYHIIPIKYYDLEIIRDVPSIKFKKIRKRKLLQIKNAKKSIIIETPYFIPDIRLIKELKKAVHRNVDVTLILPAKSDIRIVDLVSRKFFGVLHDIGIKIKFYSPSILHAKVSLVDDTKFYLGSANIDHRSSILQFEIAIFGKNKNIGRAISKHLNESIKYSDDFNFIAWEKRSFLYKYLEKILSKLINLL